MKLINIDSRSKAVVLFLFIITYGGGALDLVLVFMWHSVFVYMFVLIGNCYHLACCEASSFA